MATTLVELGLELDPMQAKCVQKALHHIHAHHHTDGHTGENHEANPDLQERKKVRLMYAKINSLLLTMMTLVKSPEVLFNPLSTVNEKKTDAS